MSWLSTSIFSNCTTVHSTSTQSAWQSCQRYVVKDETSCITWPISSQHHHTTVFSFCPHCTSAYGTLTKPLSHSHVRCFYRLLLRAANFLLLHPPCITHPAIPCIHSSGAPLVFLLDLLVTDICRSAITYHTFSSVFFFFLKI